MNPRINQMRALLNDDAIVNKVLVTQQQAAAQNAPSFQVRNVYEIGRDRVRYDLEFFRVDGASEYILDRYKAVVCGMLDIPDQTIGGVNTAKLDSMMAKVPWLEMTAAGKSDKIDDEYIMKIMKKLRKLAQSEDGLHLARLLETKHYAHAPFARGSKPQRMYDKIEELYGVSHVFAIDDLQGVNFHQAFQMLKGKAALPPPYQSRLFEVYVEKVPPQKLDQSRFELGHYHRRYFSSFKNAHDFANMVDERLFFHGVVTGEKGHQMVRHITVCDEYEGLPIASKIIHNKNKREKNAVLGWRLYENMMSLEKFCLLTNRDPASVILYKNDRTKIVLAQATDFKQTVGKAVNSPLQIKKGRGGPRLN